MPSMETTLSNCLHQMSVFSGFNIEFNLVPHGSSWVASGSHFLVTCFLVLLGKEDGSSNTIWSDKGIPLGLD